MKRLWCLLFGCYIDMGDGSNPFECYRCGAVPDDPYKELPKWSLGVALLRFIYRKCHGW